MKSVGFSSSFFNFFVIWRLIYVLTSEFCISGFECRCGGLYCSLHRYSDMHECSFDYRELGAQEIRRNNPVVVGEKIQKIWEDCCAAGLFLTPLHLLVMALKQTESASGSEPVLLFWFEPIARMTLEHLHTNTLTHIHVYFRRSKIVHTHIHSYIQTHTHTQQKYTE